MTFRSVITRAGNETTAILHLPQIERTEKSRKLTADLIPLGIDDSSKTRINRFGSDGTNQINDKNLKNNYWEILKIKNLMMICKNRI